MMNWMIPLLAWLHIGVTTSMARKSSRRDNNDDQKHPREEQIIFEPNASTEDFKHIKIPIIDVDVDAEAPQDEGEYPRVHEEVDEPPPDSEEYQAPSSEYEAPEYKPPKSGEIFDEDTYQAIVKNVQIPKIRFAGSEKDTVPIDEDLHIRDDTPEIPAELVDIKIPTSIPKPNVKIKRKPKKKNELRKPKPKIKKGKKIKERKKTKSPDQEKEYTQLIDNSNPKEEVVVIKPVKKKRPNPVFFSNELKPDFYFPTQNRPMQPRPKTRVPIRFYPSSNLKRKPKKINVVIQNKKKKPLLITHQNGDVIYWYPSKQPSPKNKKYQCRPTGYSSQCMIIAHKKPVINVPRKPQLSSYTFLRGTRPSNYFDNADKDSIFYQVVRNNPKKTTPGGLVKLSQTLFKDDNKDIGSFFKEVDDQDDEGIDEPEAENHEDERITDEEVENDKAQTDNEEEEEGEGEGEGDEEGNGGDQNEETPITDYQ